MNHRPVFLLGALLALGCSKPPPLGVEYAGCIQVLRTGPTCLLDAGLGKPTVPLAIWLPLGASDTSTEIRIDGQAIEAKGEPALDGFRYPVEVPLTAQLLEVHRQTPSGRSSWSLRLAQLPAAPEWLVKARTDASSGQADRIEIARQILTAHLADSPPLDLALHARVISALGRLSPTPGDRPEAGFEREITARRKADHLLGEAIAASVLAQRLIEGDRLAEATAAIEAVAPPSGSPAEVHFHLDYARGLVARLSGEPRAALTYFEAATAEAARLGLGELRASAEHELALTLLDLGRFTDAEARFAAVKVHNDQECAAAELATNHGWTRLLAREADTDVGDPLPKLFAARDAYDRTENCGAFHQRGNARINLALAHLQLGELDAATKDLKEARSFANREVAAERFWRRAIEARLHLARGRSREALTEWQELERLARHSGSAEDLWLALTGRAGADQALGDSPAALSALAEAEDLLDRQATAAPRPGRARFVAQREASARLTVGLLLDLGKTSEALTAARRSRSRVLRQIETEGRIEQLAGPARKEWQKAVGAFRSARRACDEKAAEEWTAAADRLSVLRSANASLCADAEKNLETAVAKLGLGAPARAAVSFRPLGTGELLLAFHPLEQGWVAFAADATGVTAHRFELPVSALSDPRDLSARLLAPFADSIRRARRIRLLPYGALRSVDLHALPFDGAPLLAGRPVVYGLDLLDRATTGTTEVRADSRPTALVIGDPRGDLPLSRQEAESVEQALASVGWKVDTERGDEATVDRLLALLPRVALLHFAGHGVAGSADGGGELLLGHEERLLAVEILNLAHAPGRIVLSGCETGRSDPDAAGEGLGLAQAFLLRGATQVVAAVRPVPDRDAAALFEEFYQPPPRGTNDFDLAARLARVQAAALRAGRNEVASFRVFEP